MSNPHADTSAEQFPRLPLYAVSGLLLFSLVAVAVVRFAAPEAGVDGMAAEQAASQVVERQALIFRDLENGAVGVFDPASGKQLTTIEPGTNGFMRSTLRGLGRERMRRNLTPDEPFEIRILDNGRALLVDPAIDREVDLWAFGETNAMNFINLFNETRAILGGNRQQVASQSAAAAGSGDRAENN